MAYEDLTPDLVELDVNSLEGNYLTGSPSVFICPECGGVMWERHFGNLQKFHCHIGHAFDAASLLESQAEEIEYRLWSLLRLLKERVTITRRLAASARDNNNPSEAQQLEAQALAALQRAEMIRQVLLVGDEASIEHEGANTVTSDQ